MKAVRFNDLWLQQLLPQGYDYPASTFVKGDNDAGKLAFELAFVASWLKAGGSLVAMLIEYPTTAVFKRALQDLFQLNTDDYVKKIMFVLFDARQDTCEQIDPHTAKANFLQPDTWNKVIDLAELQTEPSPIGTLVYAAALDLLLHSPTYVDSVIEQVAHTLKHEETRSYLFSVTAQAKNTVIKDWEEAANNLAIVPTTNNEQACVTLMQLHQPSSKTEIEIPLSQELTTLNEKTATTRLNVQQEIEGV